jgi:hypothetical protein
MTVRFQADADLNTEIRDGAQAQAVAEAIAQEALHHVAYVTGTLETLLRPMASM